MSNWAWIMLALIVIVAGASWQAFILAPGMKTRGRKSLRARRADKWRARDDHHAGGDGADAGPGAGNGDGGNGGGD